MSKTQPKNLVANYIESVWNNGDVATLENLTTEDFLYHLSGQSPRDRNNMKLFLEVVRVAFPDWRVQVQEMIAEGNSVAVRWSGTVTHKGVFHGIPPTGKQITVCGINIYSIEEGKISQEWEQMDSLGMLQQLGILPK
ncbi:ester cyclase [candidate division KSB1 bacterium]|nr:ester cyclase [candidate division KSB1 bacterium]